MNKVKKYLIKRNIETVLRCLPLLSKSVSYEKMVTTIETNTPIITVEISNDPLINSQINNKKINNLNCENKCKILKSDCFNLLKNFNEKVDIIFMDPPFKEERINKLIISITEANILKQNALIIIHRNKKNDENLSERLKIVDTRYYGLSKIIFAVH